MYFMHSYTRAVILLDEYEAKSNKSSTQQIKSRSSITQIISIDINFTCFQSRMCGKQTLIQAHSGFIIWFQTKGSTGGDIFFFFFHYNKKMSFYIFRSCDFDF